MGTELRVRQAQYAERQRDKGRHRVCYWLEPSVLAELRRRIKAQGGDTQDAANAVLQALLAQTKPASAVTKPKPTIPPPAPVLISTVEAAKRLQVTVPELNRWHKERRGPQPKYVKRRWLYDERELDEWLAAERRRADEDTAL